MASQAEAPAPWHAAFPAPKDVELGALGRDEVLKMIKNSNQSARDFVLVDVRRNDHEVSIPALFLAALPGIHRADVIRRLRANEWR